MEGRAVTLEEAFETNGYYVEVIDGENRYVTRDDKGRAVFGPRQRNAHGWMAKLHRPRRRNTAPAAPQSDADATILLPTGEELGIGVEPAQIRDATEGKWARRLKSREWHRARSVCRR